MGLKSYRIKTYVHSYDYVIAFLNKYLAVMSTSRQDFSFFIERRNIWFLYKPDICKLNKRRTLLHNYNYVHMF